MIFITTQRSIKLAWLLLHNILKVHLGFAHSAYTDPGFALVFAHYAWYWKYTPNLRILHNILRILHNISTPRICAFCIYWKYVSDLRILYNILKSHFNSESTYSATIAMICTVRAKICDLNYIYRCYKISNLQMIKIGLTALHTQLWIFICQAL
jgi:hypothetical protein